MVNTNAQGKESVSQGGFWCWGDGLVRRVQYKLECLSLVPEQTDLLGSFIDSLNC